MSKSFTTNRSARNRTGFSGSDIRRKHGVKVKPALQPQFGTIG
jgi:hypothetical protein